MCLAAFAASLDATIITTALPTITESIGGQQQYVWIANSYVLASTAIQPFFGQLANIFGRRWPMMISTGLFALGSGIAGGANGVGMLIAGRTVQGLGGGGILMLLDLITCDLVPLRERAQYIGIVLSTCAIGTTLGPIFGGAIVQGTTWRWAFYLNLPVGGVALLTMVFFLRIKHNREPTWGAALARIDYVGNVLFIGSIVSLLLGLVQGGVVNPWSSYKTIVPLVIGGVGWIVFHFHQASGLAKEPTMPPQLFTNRTSLTGYFLVWDSSMLLEWIVYFLPIYFQAVFGASPLTSGVDILPFNAFLIPFAMISGGLVTKFGQYKPLHWVGFAFLAIGCGLFSIMNSSTNKAEWVWWQVFAALGMGALLTTTLPAIQASLDEKDVAASTGTYAFLRSFGFVWGVTIPSIIFNGQFDSHIGRISDPAVRAALDNGKAYAYASGGYVKNLAADIRNEVLGAYTDSLKTVWEVAIAFALLGFVAVFIEKHVELRTDLVTEFGLDDGQKKKDPASALEAGEKTTVEKDGVPVPVDNV